MRSFAVALALGACADPGVSGEVRRVRIEPAEDNLLRFTVTAEVGLGERAFAEVRSADGGFRTPSVPAGEVALPISGLRFATGYEVEVVAVDGDGDEVARSPVEAFETEPRPDDFPTARIDAEAGSAVGWVLVNFAHTSGGLTNRMYLLDAAGEVVWYQDVLPLEPDPKEAFWDGYGWDPDAATLLALIGHRRVVVMGLDGRILEDHALEHLGSHEVRRWEGRLYVPVTRSFVHEGETWLEDGYAVLGPGGATERVTWLRDAGLDPETDPTFDAPVPRAGKYWGPWLGGASVDWTHVNAVDAGWVDGREKVWLSLKNLNQVLQLDAESGLVDWRMGDSGEDGARSRGDFVWSDDSVVDEWFGGQHGVNRGPDGTLWMFDNGNRNATSALRDARALQLAWDEAAGTVTALAAHDVGDTCSYRGSAFPLEGGEVLATCATPPRLRSFGPDGAIRWRAEFTCPAAWPSCSIYRGVPVPSLGMEPL